ncbi:Peptidyl-prolyl isomerase [Commensalibacter communis]|uniref:peptidylprolyl isomerase n=1 Tax=Commensalibacter communis TaxID=2972786 RepID=UPI0022FFA6B5|nr:peptidyl-prolyl cis-trans isomerase [Commensalibacter communis]CAI3928366.1 Peptidyl-prolyl isomerase [Commensalibacter communis]CAI3930837.1 Peptidyl-prolyl isomerase [Commensalibacter communis]
MVAVCRITKCGLYIFALTIAQAAFFTFTGMAGTSIIIPKESGNSTFSEIQPPVKPPVTNVITNNSAQILARVNDDIITVGDVKKLASNLPIELKSLPKELLYPQLTKQLIVDRALQIAIQKDGISRRPAVQQQINAAIKDLAQQKLTQAYFLAKLRPLLTPQAIQHYYNEHYINQPEIKEVNLRQIVVQSPEVAELVLQKLKAGQNFQAATRMYSIDLQNRDQNKGDMGWLTISELDQPIIQAISKIKNNEYTARAIRTNYGWVILQKVAERNRPVPSLESVESFIKEQITKEAISRIYEESLENAHIIEY